MKKLKILSIFALCILCTLTAAACDGSPMPQKKQSVPQELVETEEIPLPDPRPEQGEIKSDDDGADQDAEKDKHHRGPRRFPRVPVERPEKKIPIRPIPKPAPPKN